MLASAIAPLPSHLSWPAGVLQIEAMAQLGGLVMLDPKDQEAKEQFFFGGIEGCRFRRPVVPGDTLVSWGQWHVGKGVGVGGGGGGVLYSMQAALRIVRAAVMKPKGSNCKMQQSQSGTTAAAPTRICKMQHTRLDHRAAGASQTTCAFQKSLCLLVAFMRLTNLCRAVLCCAADDALRGDQVQQALWHCQDVC
jgi:hypothetical protein